MNRVRCAIYTRKSSEDGLEQDFNSLDAQREACEAYIVSQKHEGWVCLPELYDDGGISGGSLDRPALQRLMRAVDEKRVDQVVVYKIDRLTRSLNDFAKLVDRLDAAEASFVSVTQSFNTATSMGRLTLNVLLSFAQFEREVTAERIRDKIAASKKKGLWMGGNEPLGYEADGRSLRIKEDEAKTVRTIYQLYLEHRTVRDVTENLADLGLKSRRREKANGNSCGGAPMDRGHVHYILTNPVYAGRIRHKDRVYEGQHPPIIAPATWDQVQAMLKADAARSRGHQPKAFKSPLAGKLFDETGDRLTPSHSRKNGKRLRYYISQRLTSGTAKQHPDAWRLPAEPLERLLVDTLERHLGESHTASTLRIDPSASEINSTASLLGSRVPSPDDLSYIDRVSIRPGSLTVLLDGTALAQLLRCDPEQINPSALTIEPPFTMRRRGVELKLHLGHSPRETDRTLIQNVVHAQKWLGMILDGKTYA